MNNHNSIGFDHNLSPSAIARCGIARIKAHVMPTNEDRVSAMEFLNSSFSFSSRIDADPDDDDFAHLL